MRLQQETGCVDPRMATNRKCIYCGKCRPCPKGIPIPEVLKLLASIPDNESVSQELRQAYTQLPRQAGRCVACKRCETRCPYCVPIVKSMRKASRLFGR